MIGFAVQSRDGIEYLVNRQAQLKEFSAMIKDLVSRYNTSILPRKRFQSHYRFNNIRRLYFGDNEYIDYKLDSKGFPVEIDIVFSPFQLGLSPELSKNLEQMLKKMEKIDYAD